tara:strand:- start:9 stop:314 length:306 start_codon:yes stop_codon:yes gene_type:complete
MQKLFNTVTKVWHNVGDSDVNNPVYSTTDGTEIAEPVVAKSYKAPVVVEGYKADAFDGDADGLVQDGTPFERPEGTDLTVEEQEAAVSDTPKPKKAKKSSK